MQSEADISGPAHLEKVITKDGELYFLKAVVARELRPTKREISILLVQHIRSSSLILTSKYLNW